jgi:signal peptidase I
MGKPSRSRQPGSAILAAFVIALGMKLFLFDFIIAEGNSMLPAIKPGTLLLINRAAFGLRLPGAEQYLIRWTLPQPGNIVIFTNSRGETALKRCAASGAGGVYVLGDNTLESYDSRSYGYIAPDRILGKVVGIR